MSKAEELRYLLCNIADQLENARLKIYQTEKCEWETEDNQIDDKLFSLQSQIRNVAEEVELIEFKADNVGSKLNYSTTNVDDNFDIADAYYKIYGNEKLSSHFPEPETDRYP